MPQRLLPACRRRPARFRRSCRQQALVHMVDVVEADAVAADVRREAVDGVADGVCPDATRLRALSCVDGRVQQARGVDRAIGATSFATIAPAGREKGCAQAGASGCDEGSTAVQTCLKRGHPVAVVHDSLLSRRP